MAKKGTGILSKPPKRQNPNLPEGVKPMNLSGLNKKQRVAITQRQQSDIGLGRVAGGLMPQVEQSYSQPFDWSQLPSAPVQGDFNNWRQQQIDSTYNDFSSRMDPQFEREQASFRQRMLNEGIQPGSRRYETELQQLTRAQNDARQSALVGAQGVAGQNAQQFYNIGTDARGNALNEAFTKRNLPLNEMNMLYAGQSPMSMQNLSYSQQKTLQSQAERAAKDLQASAWHPSGGGGSDPYMGFGSAEGLWAAQDARNRANQQWEYQNNPQYRKPSTPNPWAQAGGIIGGSIIGGLLG